MNEKLLPCPFCGAGNTEIRENGKVWSGIGHTRPTSTSVFHHCRPVAGQPSRAIERVGRDRASAIAAWNQRAEVAQTRVDESFEDRMSDWAHGDSVDALRYRWLRANRDAMLLTSFFGHGCVNRSIFEVDAAIDEAIWPDPATESP